jgi:hypothetical protein
MPICFVEPGDVMNVSFFAEVLLGALRASSYQTPAKESLFFD